MRQEKSGARAGKGASRKSWLISDAKLLTLHRKLLKTVDRDGRDRASAENDMAQYAAARVAVWSDLNRADTVIESASAAQMRGALETGRGIKTKKNRRVVVLWRDEADASWHAALEQARAQSLPIVFVGHAGKKRGQRAALPRAKTPLKPGEELPCVTVDGHDVVASYRVAHEAIDRARRGRGPTRILLATYRIGGAAFTDAVADMERYLEGRGLLNAGTRGQAPETRKAKKGTSERGSKKAGRKPQSSVRPAQG
jgi:hypothetical protein